MKEWFRLNPCVPIAIVFVMGIFVWIWLTGRGGERYNTQKDDSRIEVKAKVLRDRVLSAFEKEGLEGEQFAIVAAMGFGDKSGLSHETRDTFSQTGAAHLLALSGMHLGILFVLLSMFVNSISFLLGSRTGFKFFAQVLVVVTVWCYVVMVGMPKSVVRSAVMLTLYAALSSSTHEKMSLNVLAVTAIIMLIANPLSVMDVGFQMSFMAMVGIFVYFPPIYNILGDEWLFNHPFLRKIWALIVVSIAAQVTTMPLSAFYFGRIPVLFLLTNLVAIPLVTLLLYSVFLCVVLWFVPFLRAAFIFVIQHLTSWLTVLLETIGSWDITSINNISINWIQLMLIYMMIIVMTIMLTRVRIIFLGRRKHL